MSVLVPHPIILPTVKIPHGTDPVAVAHEFLPNLSSLGPEAFDENGIWRDVFALTGTLRTFYGAASISAAWNETSKIVQPGSFSLNPKSCKILDIPGLASWVSALFSFETAGTPQTSCSAIVALVQAPSGGWRIWCLRTILEQLEGQGNVDVLEPVKSASTVFEYVNRAPNGVSKLTNGFVGPKYYDCVVIGGGQAGLSVGGRLQALEISYVIFDKQDYVGDSWKSRYTSLKLHTLREYAHLPFDRTFPAHYPEFLTKDHLAQGYQDWVSKFGINIQQKSKVVSGTWDSSRKLWSLTVVQDGQEQLVKCSHVIVSGGAGGQIPKMPEYPDRNLYQGTVLHSAQYKNATAWKGKRGVVIGTANTGHDVADDMLEAGLSEVTMVQRSKTYIVPFEFYQQSAAPFYNDSFPTELADKLGLTEPYVVADLMSQGSLHAATRQKPEIFDALEKAGFRVERYGSLVHHLFNRSGGHYMDVGTSTKIAKGLIKIKPIPPSPLPIRYTPTGLSFPDGTALPADLIVFATGFQGNMRYLVAEIFGDEVAEQMGDCWGLDGEGELRGWGYGHPGLWYHGGTQGQARYFSRFVALRIKAELMGTPLKVYDKTP